VDQNRLVCTGMSFPLKELCLRMRRSGAPSNMVHLAHVSPNPKRHLDRFSRFCTAQCRASLYFTMGRPFPLKIAPSHGFGPWTPSNTWFLGPTRFLNQNGISIGSAVFTGLTTVRGRPTDHATRSVTKGRIYVRSTAMRPNNNNKATGITLRPRCCPW